MSCIKSAGTMIMKKKAIFKTSMTKGDIYDGSQNFDLDDKLRKATRILMQMNIFSQNLDI